MEQCARAEENRKDDGRSHRRLIVVIMKVVKSIVAVCVAEKQHGHRLPLDYVALDRKVVLN